MTTHTTSRVRQIDAAPADIAREHHARRLALETDCADVYAVGQDETRDFVLVDVRSSECYEQGHVPGAVSLPYTELTQVRIDAYPDDTLFVVYCAGPHCNGANRGALRIASLGRPVKEMIGGMAGWRHEGFDIEFSGTCST